MSFYTRYFNLYGRGPNKILYQHQECLWELRSRVQKLVILAQLGLGLLESPSYSNIKISEHLELEPLEVDTEELIQRNSEEAEVPTEGEALVM